MRAAREGGEAVDHRRQGGGGSLVTLAHAAEQLGIGPGELFRMIGKELSLVQLEPGMWRVRRDDITRLRQT